MKISRNKIPVKIDIGMRIKNIISTTNNIKLRNILTDIAIGGSKYKKKLILLT